MEYLLNIKLKKDDVFFGPGPAKLLQKIHNNSSISKAAKEMDMSYSKAWKMIKRMEAQLGFKVTITNVGGKGGGNTILTAEGYKFLKKYNVFLEDIKNYANIQFEEYFNKKKDET